MTKNNLEYFRKQAKLTREELAELVGTTSTTIYRKERGERRLSSDELSTYAKALGISPKDLIGDEQDVRHHSHSSYQSPALSDDFTLHLYGLLKHALLHEKPKMSKEAETEFFRALIRKGRDEMDLYGKVNLNEAASVQLLRQFLQDNRDKPQ